MYCYCYEHERYSPGATCSECAKEQRQRIVDESIARLARDLVCVAHSKRKRVKKYANCARRCPMIWPLAAVREKE